MKSPSELRCRAPPSLKACSASWKKAGFAQLREAPKKRRRPLRYLAFWGDVCGSGAHPVSGVVPCLFIAFPIGSFPEGKPDRDLKPANIMVMRLGDNRYRPVLMDFGLARDVNAGAGLTESGCVMGTPWYMSPEQTRGEVRTMDRRTDIYSLGATLYELIAGRPPFHAATTVDALIEVMLHDAPSLGNLVENLPKGLDVVVGKCLNKEPAQRYATAHDLAMDLLRLLEKQPVVAKKLGLFYRLRWRARHNKPAATAAVALVLSLLALVGYGVYDRIQALHRERRARQQTALAQRLGETIGQLEVLARLAYAMPLHDTRYELSLVRTRMREIESELRKYGELGTPLAHYALGRGHLALHEWPPALAELSKARDAGLSTPELGYALGRVLGALYSDGLAAARKSGDRGFFYRRKQELTQTYLEPALQHLENSRHLDSVSTSYVEGLIDYYEQHYDAALLHAQMAQRQTPWAYEALKLAGDVYLTRGLGYKERGDYEAAERSLKEGLRLYEQSSEMGRSDYQIHESIAEIVIRQMELDGLRGQNPQERLQRALLAADHALEADPVAASGHAKKAFAYLFWVQYLEGHGHGDERVAALNALIHAGEQAVATHPRDEYAHDVLGNGYVFRARYKSERQESPKQDLVQARKHLSLATLLNPRFPWAFNDLGGSYLVEGDDRLARYLDPSDAYGQAIAALSQAVALDPEYQFAYANMALTYSSLARFYTETGRDPSDVINKCNAFADAANRIDKNNLVALGGRALASLMMSIYQLDANIPIDENTAGALKNIDQFSMVLPDIPMPYQYRAAANYFLAKQNSRRSVDPSKAIENGLAAIADCQHRANGTDGTCESLHAMIFVLQAERAPNDAAREAAVMAALGHAKQAEQDAPADLDVLQMVAEAYWRMARLRRAKGHPVAAELLAGMAASQKVLARAPSWPRALAVHGGLAALYAATAGSPAAQQHWQEQARNALFAAEKGNSHLRNSYRDAFADGDAAIQSKRQPATPLNENKESPRSY